MKCKIEFRPWQYYKGQPAYELLYYRSYDAGDTNPHYYWDTAGFFPNEEVARKVAVVIKEKNNTINFEV